MAFGFRKATLPIGTVPLKGDGLRVAQGENQNEYFFKPKVKQPLVSTEILPLYPELKRVYEYDIMTQPGQDYHVERSSTTK